MILSYCKSINISLNSNSGKYTIVFLTFLIINMNVFAQESNAEENVHSFMSIGLGLEWNMNSRENFAGGAGLYIDFNLPSVPLSLGLNAGFNSNFQDNFVFEISWLLRWYFLGKNYIGFFAQADLGTVFISENNELTPLFMGGLRGGFRFPLGIFYIEPYGRTGYPFMFGIGVNAGMRIGDKS